ncbi:SMI1/KNR4 family protein [Streptomyces cinnamoneus]|uniref:SMI1/KNR4 family protein n=1 Tax=Streptomyces cinnamoneus TaxID=53446 RepID=A0A2G1XEA4_STRCJ|nr:SMI1/KNR4 family protein [Streptomyces cinnamoneus]PHQ49535.1 SMI1/KNR4 family protein [Streptomyces cinnamoneus]PPT14745.1 SMI1/KNR4 family protein [Streptomyces cinnamoneus]
MTDKTGADRRFPPALADAARTSFSYGEDGVGIDFEPYDAFDSAEETTGWLRQWTGNPAVDGDAYRVFGQDGAGGLVALWCARPGRPLTEQPVVYIGSEGECGVVAGDLSGFLWVLADGFGPMAAALYGAGEADEAHETGPGAAPAELAARHATTPRRPAREIVAEAQAEFPAFAEGLCALCR